MKQLLTFNYFILSFTGWAGATSEKLTMQSIQVGGSWLKSITSHSCKIEKDRKTCQHNTKVNE